MSRAGLGAGLDAYSHPAAISIADDHDGFRTFARGTLEPVRFTVAEETAVVIDASRDPVASRRFDELGPRVLYPQRQRPPST